MKGRRLQMDHASSPPEFVNSIIRTRPPNEIRAIKLERPRLKKPRIVTFHMLLFMYFVGTPAKRC